MGHILSESISEHMKNKVAIGNSQHRFLKHKSRLTSLMNCSDRTTGSVDGGKAADAKSLASGSLELFIHNPWKCGLNDGASGGLKAGCTSGLTWW